MARRDSPLSPFWNRTPPSPFGDTSESALSPKDATSASGATHPRYVVHGMIHEPPARDPGRDHIQVSSNGLEILVFRYESNNPQIETDHSDLVGHGSTNVPTTTHPSSAGRVTRPSAHTEAAVTETTPLVPDQQPGKNTSFLYK